MKPISSVIGTAVPLDRSDVDTDQVIPSDWLKRVERTGFEKGLFAEWREDPNFVLNDPRFAGANILVTGVNFGTGSSREHAVWAIHQAGFEAVVSPGFADIFRNNCTKNGLVPVTVDPEFGARLMSAVQVDPRLEIQIDLERLEITAPGAELTSTFPMDGGTQERFLQGLDDISLTLRHTEQIDVYESNRSHWLPKSA